MTTSEICNQMKFTPAQLLQMTLMGVTTEDPLEYLDKEYCSLNIGMLEDAIISGKQKFQEMNKIKDNKKLNCYLTVGGDSFNKSFWNGCIATLLWLEDFIGQANKNYGIKEEEIEVTKNVLSRMMLPKITDVTVEGTNLKTISNCQQYAAFLFAVANWCSSGLYKIKTSESAHTNMEVVRLLTSTSLNNFPSLPFAAYFIGQIKNNDIFNVTEQMGKFYDFRKYMSDQSIMLNEPKFVVQTDNSPICGIVGHPLTNWAIAEKSKTGNGVEWLGLFEKTKEFEEICVKNGFSAEDVKKYLLMLSKETHENNLKKKNKLAEFCESQHLVKTAIELNSSRLVK